jgi:hypothetical protein
VATIDRIERGYTPWPASAAGFRTTDEQAGTYVGRHRRGARRGLNVLRMFYRGRHRRR